MASSTGAPTGSRNGLLAAGVKPGARIAVLDKNHPSFFELLFGATKARAVLVPVNFRLAPPEIAFVLNDAKAEMLFVRPRFRRRRERDQGGRSRTCGISSRIAGEGARLLQRLARPAIGQDPELPDAGRRLAIQMYTSGTTGRPKGAQLSQP